MRMTDSPAPYILFICLITLTTGRVCIKRLVGDEWISSEDCEEPEAFQSVINNIQRLAAQERREEVTSIPASIPRGCRNIALESAKSHNNTGGVFDIDVINIGVTEVYCDMTTDSGGWIVFQRRINGNLDFNRNWTEYATGFGNVRGQFWLGLEKIDKLTNKGDCELRIDMISNHGERYYAKYSLFKVSTASDNYRLTVSGYSGNATDSFKTHNNKPFSTFDKDNDAAPYNCAGSFRVGWWYDKCQIDFKGFFGNAGGIWPAFTLNGWVYLDFIEMKLRKKN